MPLGAERQEGWEDRTHNLKPCPQVQLERCLQAPSELLVPQPQVGGVCVGLVLVVEVTVVMVLLVAIVVVLMVSVVMVMVVLLLVTIVVVWL